MRTRKRYSEAFKREAVEYLISSGKSKLKVAEELGISDVSLLNWSREFAGDSTLKTPDMDQLTPEQLARENKRLQEENRYLKRQREILKKAMSILSEEPDGGMQ